MYVGVRILLNGGQIVLIFVLVPRLDDVAIRVVSRRVALENVSLVACMFDSLYPPDC
jgi:hypothetical protein